MNAVDIVTRITLAITNTRPVLTPKGTLHWADTLAQRSGKSPMAAGSIYPDMSPDEIEAALLSATWEPYTHPAIMTGCTAFRAPIQGLFGMVDLATLAPDTTVVLDDRKNTGNVSATVAGFRGEAVDFTVLILGMEGDREIVFTFHPGAPVSPSKVAATPGLHGKNITAAEAIGMGLETAKIV